MRFIYPSFLWALLLIAIPIIIHLVNLRRHQTVYFSNVNLLKRVRRDTQKKSKLKQLLILACRVLTIAAMVLAFAKPYLPQGAVEKQLAHNVVGIYIDNSFSMNAQGTEGRAIESAKQKAFAIVDGSRPDTKFALLTNSLSELQNRFYSKTEIVGLIADVETGHNWTSLSTIQSRFVNMMENFLLESNRSVYLVSDFQKHTTDIPEFEADSITAYHFVPVPVNKVSNIFIDSVWFEAPTHHLHQLEVLYAKIVNSSSEDYYQVPVNLYVNDTLKALSGIDLKAGEALTINLQYTNLSSGQQFGRIEITDYPITYDNTLYFAYEVKSELKALIIEQRSNRTTRNLRALFMNDSYIDLDVERADRLQISNLDNYSAIFLNELKGISTGLAEQLVKFVQEGGSLVIIPELVIDTDSYNNLFGLFGVPPVTEHDTITIPIGNVAYNHPLYTNVFKDDHDKVALPDIKWRYRFSTAQQFAESNILAFADQSKALSLSNIDYGKLYVFAFPFSPVENQFMNHLLFLPTVYNMVLQSSFNQELYRVIGQSHSFDIKLSESSRTRNIMVKNLQNNVEMIPTTIQQRGNTLRLSINGDLDAGFYRVYANNGTESGLAFNYNLKESELEYFIGNELLTQARNAELSKTALIEASAKNMVSAIERIEKGAHFWKLFIAFALMFIICEAAIIRFWK
jgi:hypothetical protein